MMDLIEAPDTIDYLLDQAVNILVRCANAELESGADAIAIGEGGAGGSMLSPQMHERFLLDVHRRLISSIQGPTIMHICGDITPRLDTLSQVGLYCFNFDWAISPHVMVRKAGGAFRLMGNISTSDLLLGQPADVEQQVFENLDAGVDIISPGCAISPQCSNANLRSMVDAVIKWHKTHA